MEWLIEISKAFYYATSVLQKIELKESLMGEEQGIPQTLLSQQLRAPDVLTNPSFMGFCTGF